MAAVNDSEGRGLCAWLTRGAGPVRDWQRGVWLVRVTVTEGRGLSVTDSEGRGLCCADGLNQTAENARVIVKTEGKQQMQWKKHSSTLNH